MTTPPTDRPLTAGEALAKLFMDNADRGANAANDTLIEQVQQRIRALRKTRDDPDRPPVERSPRQLPVAGRHHSGRSDPGPGAVDAGVPVGYAHGFSGKSYSSEVHGGIARLFDRCSDVSCVGSLPARSGLRSYRCHPGAAVRGPSVRPDAGGRAPVEYPIRPGRAGI